MIEPYEVSVDNTFEASSPEDAVRQMVEWLLESASTTVYRVTNTEGIPVTGLYDAEKINREVKTVLVPEDWWGRDD